MNETIFDEPIEMPISKVIGYSLRFDELVLGKSVLICVELKYLTGKKKSSEQIRIKLEGDEYLAWGSDDNYINEIIKSKILTLLVGVEPLEN